ncbi:Transcription initiation factor IIA subunit [Arachis hypogaea]|nr:Transcription initiation factor IIA subunit [Arachis hypogaea]
MAATATVTTSQVYIDVIEDVIVKVRDEFINNAGPGEEVLKELQALWESKMIQAGVLVAPIERSSGTKTNPVQFTILMCRMRGMKSMRLLLLKCFSTYASANTNANPLPGTVDNSMYNIPTGSSDYTSSGNDADVKGGQPTTTASLSWMNQRPSLDVNVAYDDGRDEAGRGTSNQPLTQEFFKAPMGKRKRDDLASQYNNADGYIPQQDGAGDSASGSFEVEVCGGRISINAHHTTSKEKIPADLGRPTSRIPQLDGPIPFDDDMLSTPNIYNYEGVLSEDYNIANTPAPPEIPASTPALVAQNEAANDNEDDDDDDEPLNENDDDDDFDDLDQGEDQDTHHLVLAQFDKVTRTKSRWKCTLKDGIMHINNKDILFNKATGEFDF